jgi:YD repeat-containing protein
MMLNALIQAFCFAAVVALLTVSSVLADQAQYIYDDLGRLTQVTDGQGEWG